MNAVRHQVSSFNARHRVGTRVMVRQDDGQFVETVTTAPAEVLDDVPLIRLRAFVEPYHLSRIVTLNGPR